MSQSGRKKRMTKGRKRALPGVKSDAGKAQVETARQWVRDQFNIRAQIGEPRPDLLWMKALSGYQEAHASAVDAATNIIAETGFAREMAVTPLSQHWRIFERWKLRTGIGQPNEIIADLIRATHPDQLLEILYELTQDLHNTLRSGPPSPLFGEIARNPQVFVHGPRQTAGEIATLILGKMMSPMRASVPALWIQYGLWLAEVPDAVAIIETRMQVIPELEPLSSPTDETLRAWISKMRLFRYQGKGRLRYYQGGEPRPDQALLTELAHARRSQPAFGFLPNVSS